MKHPTSKGGFNEAERRSESSSTPNRYGIDQADYQASLDRILNAYPDIDGLLAAAPNDGTDKNNDSRLGEKVNSKGMASKIKKILLWLRRALQAL